MDEHELSYLRDFHAGFALLGLITKARWNTKKELADTAYEIADAMQEARLSSAKKFFNHSENKHEEE